MFKERGNLPIGWKLTGWFGGILATVLLGFSLTLLVILQSNLSARIDESLERRANDVQRKVNLLTQNPNGAIGVSGLLEIDPLEEFADPGVYVQILDKQGKVLGDSASLGRAQLPIDPALVLAARNNSTSTSEAQVSSERVRIYYKPISIKNEITWVLQVGESLKTYTETLNRVRFFLLLVGLIALGITTVGGWWLTRRALRPVVIVTEAARRIARTRDFDERIPQAPTFKGHNDEIGELAATFNQMIEELGRVFDTNRQFMADTSHELRTPLTIIQGNLELLKRGLPPEEAAAAIEETRDEAASLSHLVTDLLLLAQADAGQMVEKLPLELAPVAEKAFGRAQQLVITQAKALTLRIERLDSATVIGDEYRLGQVIFNLLENAVRYTPEGGEVTLSLGVEQNNSKYPGGVARLQVRDTGTGIAPEHLPHLFERFYRVDKARSRALGGAGLGLAIVKYIIEAHNGQVLVESQPGKGSTFTVVLPLQGSQLIANHG